MFLWIKVSYDGRLRKSKNVSPGRAQIEGKLSETDGSPYCVTSSVDPVAVISVLASA
jgi:hypothetical protein